MNKKENGTIGFCDSPPATCPLDPSPARHQWKQASLLCWLPLSPFHNKKVSIQAQQEKALTIDRLTRLIL